MGKRQQQTEVRETRAHSNRGGKKKTDSKDRSGLGKKEGKSQSVRSEKESNTHMQPDND